MSNVFRTLCIPAAQLTKAQAICDAIGYPEKGAFIGKMALSGTEPTTGADTRPMAGYIASGIFDSNSPLLGSAATMFAACKGAPGITLSDCQALVAAMDATAAEPHSHRAALVRECNGTEVTTAWVQPTGAQDAYPFDAAVTYGGKKWRSLTPANVWQPGVANWREFWSTGAPPMWIQPTGSTDAYAVGARVTWKSQVWQSNTPANVWEPGVFGWDVVP